MSPEDFDELTKASLAEELEDTKGLIEGIKSMGADVESAEIIFSQAEKALEGENLEMSKALIESTLKTLTLVKQQYFVQAASILFSSLQRSIVSIEGSGSEVSYIKDLYNKAKEKFDSGQYEDAMDYFKSAQDMVKELIPDQPQAGSGRRNPPAHPLCRHAPRRGFLEDAAHRRACGSGRIQGKGKGSHHAGRPDDPGDPGMGRHCSIDPSSPRVCRRDRLPQRSERGRDPVGGADNMRGGSLRRHDQ